MFIYFGFLSIFMEMIEPFSVVLLHSLIIVGSYVGFAFVFSEIIRKKSNSFLQKLFCLLKSFFSIIITLCFAYYSVCSIAQVAPSGVKDIKNSIADFTEVISLTKEPKTSVTIAISYQDFLQTPESLYITEYTLSQETITLIVPESMADIIPSTLYIPINTEEEKAVIKTSVSDLMIINNNGAPVYYYDFLLSPITITAAYEENELVLATLPVEVINDGMPMAGYSISEQTISSFEITTSLPTSVANSACSAIITINQNNRTQSFEKDYTLSLITESGEEIMLTEELKNSLPAITVSTTITSDSPEEISDKITTSSMYLYSNETNYEIIDGLDAQDVAATFLNQDLLDLYPEQIEILLGYINTFEFEYEESSKLYQTYQDQVAAYVPWETSDYLCFQSVEDAGEVLMYVMQTILTGLNKVGCTTINIEYYEKDGLFYCEPGYLYAASCEKIQEMYLTEIGIDEFVIQDTFFELQGEIYKDEIDYLRSLITESPQTKLGSDNVDFIEDAMEVVHNYISYSLDANTVEINSIESKEGVCYGYSTTLLLLLQDAGYEDVTLVKLKKVDEDLWHAILALPVNGEIHYLDPTANDYHISSISLSDTYLFVGAASYQPAV